MKPLIYKALRLFFEQKNVQVPLGVYITPVSALLIAQPSWGQTQNSSAQQAQQLLEQGKQQTRQYKHKQAIQTFQQALILGKKLKDQKLQATVLLWLGFTHNNIGERQRALKFYNQSLRLIRAVGDRSDFSQ